MITSKTQTLGTVKAKKWRNKKKYGIKGKRQLTSNLTFKVPYFSNNASKTVNKEVLSLFK